MLEQNQNKNQTESINNGQSRAHLTLLILILGILSIASIGILTLAMLRQMYPKVFAAPGIAKQLNYQGKLQDAGGVVVPDGTYGMQFTIYDAASGGNILWTARESDACGAPFNPAAKSTSTYKGIFSTLLGETGDCAINLDFADDTYYLGVTVGADPEMTPRKRIGAAGYAFNADLLDGLNTSNAGGANDFVPVTNASGNLFLTRDFTVTSPEVGGQAVYGAATDTSANINYGGYFTAAGTGFTPPFGFTAGVYGEATSAAAIANLGGYFVSRGTGANATGVAGLASATGAVQNIGGLFIAQGDTGRGVYGFAMGATSTQKYGVFGDSQGTGAGSAGVRGRVTGNADDISGVYGEANSASPGNFKTYAGRFYTNGWQGRAVFGEAVSPPGTGVTNYGGYFTAGSDLGRGVYGEASQSNSPTNYGGYFLANGGTGRGVYGEASAAGPNANYGGYFTAAGTGANAAGVYGAATGTIAANYGGYFESAGVNGSGVFAKVTDISGVNYAITAETSSPTGYGAYAYNLSGTGLGYGVWGGVSSPDGYGVKGETGWGTGTGRGVYGVTHASGGYGVYGYSDNPLGGSYAVYGNTIIASDWSGYFTGGQGAYADKAKIGPATTAPAESLDIVGNIANLADATFNPSLKSTTATGAGVINLFVSGRYAYILNSAAATLQIFDVTEPTAPVSMSSMAIAANPRYVYVSGRYAYIVHDTVTSTLEILDISDPTAPVFVSSTATGLDPKAIYVSGHYAYIADTGPDMLEIFDVSNPVSPVSVGSVPTSVDPFHVFVSGKYAYVVSQAPASNLEIFNISNPAAPAFVGAVFAPGDPRGVYVSGRYAYVANLGGTLQVFDISNPVVPVMVGSVAAGSPYSIFVSGRYAYVADIFGSTVKTVDVSKPSAPIVVGSAATGSSPTSVFVSGRYAYLANAGANNFEIFDVSGLETTSGMVHSLEVGNLQARNDITVQGELNVEGGLNVGGTGLFNDSLSVHSIGPVGGYFQADGASAVGLTGFTTNSWGTALSGFAFGADSTGISAAADPLAAGLTLSRGGSFAVGTGSATISGASHMMGVEGIADGGTATNYGGVFAAGNLVSRTLAGQNNIGVAGFAEDSAGTNYGVYGSVSVSGWAGYFTGGDGLYADRLSIADITSGVAYNTIGTAATSHGFASASDLFVAGQLEVDGASWFDGGHTDLAEMINYTGNGEAGDVIVIDEENDNTARLSDKAYDTNVIGIISTNPSLVITGDIKDGKLLAVAGRVPTKVTAANGPVGRGDLLTTSSKPGHAMKATEPGPIVGKALEPCLTDSCTIWVFLNVGWYGGISNNVAVSNTPVSYTQTTVSNKLTADLDANGFVINNVSRISSIDGKWSIDENGLLKSKVEFVRDNETVEKDIYALSSTGVEVVLSGSGKMDGGEMLVDFSQVDKDFTEIIDGSVPLKISVTPTESCGGLYVAEKYPQGFKVKELNNGTSGATFDWIVIGQRKGYETAAERQ